MLDVDHIISARAAVAGRMELYAGFPGSPGKMWGIWANANPIKGVICGMRVDEIDDPTMRKIRFLDKLIDELAQGKKMVRILRQTQPVGSS